VYKTILATGKEGIVCAMSLARDIATKKSFSPLEARRPVCLLPTDAAVWVEDMKRERTRVRCNSWCYEIQKL